MTGAPSFMAASVRTSDPAEGVQRYLIALGSNRWHHRHGAPRRALAAAITALRRHGLAIRAEAPVIASRPIGPSQRTFANGAVIVETVLDPPALLALLHRIEAAFGRSRRAQAWSARVLDLDIVLWSGGCWASPDLIIPHRHFRDRVFVLGPARAIAPAWRDPLSGLTPRHLHARLTASRPIPKPRTR